MMKAKMMAVMVIVVGVVIVVIVVVVAASFLSLFFVPSGMPSTQPETTGLLFTVCGFYLRKLMFSVALKYTQRF